MTNVLSHNKLTARWPLGRRTKKPAEFEHVHLPDDGQEFLKASPDMLIQELDTPSGTEREDAVVHFRAGEDRFGNWQYRDAADLYQASFEVFESLSALLARGVALMMVSELKEASEVFEQGRNLSMQREAGRFEAAFGINLGQVCNDLGEPGRSREALEEARDLSAEIDQPVLEANALRHLGTTFLTQALYDDALATCEEAIQIADEIGDEKSIGHILCNKAVFLAARGNLNDAEEVFRECVTLGRGLKDPYVLGRVYTNLAGLYLVRGSAVDAIPNLERALEIHRGSTYCHGEARNLGMLAIAKVAEGQLHEGNQSIEQAIEIDRKLEYRRGKAGLLHMAAGVYLLNDELQRAYELFQLASETAKEIRHCHIHIDASAMITLLKSDSEIDTKISTLEEAKRSCCLIRNPILEIGILRHLSLLVNDSGRLSETIELAKQALSISREIGNLVEEAKSLWNLSLVYGQQGETENAVQYASIAQAMFQSQGIEAAGLNIG